MAWRENLFCHFPAFSGIPFLRENFVICHLAFAQDSDKLVSLSKQIMDADTNARLYPAFEELKEIYFRDNKFEEFVVLLSSLEAKKKPLAPFSAYYTALSRYQQLKYLEEKQGWDEYFAQGNTYRDELTMSARKAIDSTAASDALGLYARLLLWQFHQGQQDNLADAALAALMQGAREYAKANPDPAPIKITADKLSSYAFREKSSQLYRLYAEKLVSSGTKDEELSSIAGNFFREGNLELAENIYDIYTARISADKPKALPILTDLAKSFSYYRDEGPKDPFYAEKLFKKIEELGGREIFDQELIYLRAFNLEKSKEYKQAKEIYAELIRAFPDSARCPEAAFKSGLISAYVLGDRKEAQTYFKQLGNNEKAPAAQAMAALYQLGLFAQWENDFAQAGKYYRLFLEQAGINYPETLALTLARLKEMEEKMPLEYNLKAFLDLAFSGGGNSLEVHKIDINAAPFRLDRGAQLEINSSAYSPQTGCMQIELEYLWSGDLGSARPSLKTSSFNTSYSESGTKIICLVVVSPSGFLDRNIDIIDIR
ncbi:MAG: hypothetical protein Q8N85_01895 [Candidatus Omnitrophota bacterium]|nr:hypothetical protein [Candidatus Omnitrophota bacterium]